MLAVNFKDYGGQQINVLKHVSGCYINPKENQNRDNIYVRYHVWLGLMASTFIANAESNLAAGG